MFEYLFLLTTILSLFRERGNSVYFRSASSNRDNKLLFVLGLGTRLLFTLLLASSQ